MRAPKKTKHETLIRYSLYVPVLILLYILQSAIFSRLPILGAKPLIIPIAAICIAVLEGSVRGGVLGLISGILCDISFNHPPIIFTLAMTVICLAVGLLADYVLARGFPTFLASCVVSLLVCAYIQMSGILLSGGSFAALAVMAFKQLLYSLLFAVPIYYLMRSISRIPKTQ